jgi:hypothetical protein
MIDDYHSHPMTTRLILLFLLALGAPGGFTRAAVLNVSLMLTAHYPYFVAAQVCE